MFRASQRLSAYNNRSCLSISQSLRTSAAPASAPKRRPTKLFSTKSTESERSPNTWSLNGRLKRANYEQDYAKALCVLDLFRNSGAPPDAITYKAILNNMARSRLSDEVWAVLSDMEACGVTPDDGCISQLLRATMHDNHSWDKAFRYLAHHSLPIGQESYSIILSRYVRQKNLEMCTRTLHDMARDGIHPRQDSDQLRAVFTLAASEHHPRLAIDLIKAYEKHLLQEVESDVWDQILRSSVEAQWVDGVRSAMQRLNTTGAPLPEPVVFNILLLAKSHDDRELADEMLAYVVDRLNLPLADRHYSPVLQLYALKGDSDALISLLTRMDSEDVQPTHQTISTVAKIVSRNVNVTKKLHRKALDLGENGGVVPRVLVPLLLKAYTIQRRFNDATQLFRSPVGQKNATIECYNSMLSSCMHRGDQAGAEKLFQELLDAKLQPDGGTYVRMFQVALKQPNYEPAFYWLETMKAASFVPARRIYLSLVERLQEAGDPRVQQAKAEMEDKGQPRIRRVGGSRDQIHKLLP